MPALIEISEFEQFSRLFRGKAGNALARALMHALRIDKVQKSSDAVGDLRGCPAATEWLRLQDVRTSIQGLGYLENLPQGPFITVSNHPIGSVDGIILLSLIGQIRPDYKVMVNKILSRVKIFSDAFITVTPTGAERTDPTAESIRGVRLALQHLREGHPLGLFPSGAVSDLIPGKCPTVQMPDGAIYTEPQIRDREWQMPIVKFIRKAGVPVVPIRFFDGNTPTFYRLGLIDWRVRLLRLPTEAINKSGQTLRLGVGPVISPEQIAACPDDETLRTLLRGSVYSQTI